MEHFVEFEDVCKYYQTGSVKIAAADHMSFYVDKGEFCIIVGPSGAGKTTLLNILGGMDSCDEGSVWLDGRNVARFTPKELTTYRRYDVGFPRAGKEPQAAAVRRAHRRAGLQDRQAGAGPAAGHLPPHRTHCHRHYPQHRPDRHGRPHHSGAQRSDRVQSGERAPGSGAGDRVVISC